MAEIEGRIHDSGNLVGEIFGGSSTPPVIQPKTITGNGTYPAPSGVDGFSPVTVNVPGIVPTGTKNITQNGDHDVTQYAVAHVSVPSPQINLQDKTVTENGDVTADEGYDGLGTVTVSVQSPEPTYQEKSVTAPATGTTAVTPDSGYDGLSKVTVSPTPTETKSINANGTYTPSSGKHIGTVIVNVPSDTPETQEKTVSPSTSQQIVEPDSGKLLSKVTVSAIQTETKSATPSESAQQITPTSGKFLTRVDVGAVSSDYVGSGVPRKSSADLTASGATVNVPTGYYSVPASKAIASGTAGTPTAAKGAVSNHQISVTPSVTNTTGYINGGTKTGTPVTVFASELVSGSETKTQNGTYDVTNLQEIVVNVSGSGETASMYAGSTAPSSAEVDDLWMDTSDEGGGLPDVILPGSTPVKMSSDLGGGTNSTTDVAIGSSLTISKAGTYRIRCSMFRSSNASSATWKLYLAKNGTRISDESPTWDSTTRRTAEIRQDVTCAAGDVLQMRGSVSSNSYWIFCSPIVACIDWDLGV